MPNCSQRQNSVGFQFFAILVTLAVFFQASALQAQSNRYSGQAFEPLTNTYFHLQYEGGDDWAQGTQQTQFGGTRFVDALSGNGLWLQYGQFGFDHDGHHSLNAGVVRRFWLGGGIVGFGGHYDLTRSDLGNDFQKVAVTGEWFSADNNWTVRGEGNFAVGPDSFLIQDLGTTVDELFFQGNNLMIGQSAGQLREEGMSGLEYELARSLGNYAAEGYLGGYHYLGQIGDDANGIKGGVRGFVSPGVFANLEVREDNVFGTSLYGGVTLFLGGPSRSQTHTLADQLIMPVQRHNQAIVNTVDTRVLLPDVAVTQGGNAITFTHIDNVNTGDGGDSGTYEDPYTSLAAANGSSSDIVYVHSGTTYTNDSYQMSNGQRFLGEGGGNQHQLMTDQFGLINLPEVNGIAGARPVIRGGTNPILVAGNSEISNFNIEQASRTLMFDNVAGDVDVNRLTGSGAIYINGGSGDYAFSDVHIVDSNNGGLFIDGGSANVIFDGIYGGSSLSVLDGYAVAIQDSHTGTVLFPTSSSITTTNAQGFSFLDGLSGTYIFNGTNSILNSSDDALLLANSGGTYVFGENTSITNSGDSAVSLDLAGVSDIGFVYGGTILNNNGHAIQVSGGTGTQLQVAFGSSAEDAIQDNAEGISITDTDADVAINSDTELTGSNGLYIGDSDGTYTFTNTDIELSSGTGAAMRISGGSSTVNFGDDSLILNTTLDREVLRVENGHTGTLNMEGVVGAAAGDGLVFDNADGTYNFTGTTVFNGSTRGIDVGNGSSGTFDFSSTTAIANTTDEAIRMDLANADNLDFTYSGLIRNATGRAIDISGGPGTGQSVVFNSTEEDAILDGGAGIRIANTDADVNIQADTELTGSNGVEIINSNGTYTFADTDIALSSGADPSLSISGGSSAVNFGADSSITNGQNRSVVNVLDGHTGTLTMDGNISSTAGSGIVFDNADGTYNFNGMTSLDGTARGIVISNGSAGTFSFSENTSIANTTSTGIEMDLANADNFDFTYSGTLQNSNGLAIDISGGPGTGQSVLFNSTAEDAIQDSGLGISISNTSTDINFLADTELTGSIGLRIANYSGTASFADTDINLSSGTNSSLYVDGGTGTVNFGTDSSIAHDLTWSAIQVDGGHTGTLNIDGNVAATSGDGLVFNNADGTYNFNGTTNLNGTTRGIYVFNGSSGTFGFSENTSIANVTGSAVDLNLANADNLDFTYSGTIQNSTGLAIDISGGPGTGQSVLFNSTIADAIQDSGDGISIYNTAADVNIQSDVELTGSRGVTITDSTGTYTFADTDINLSSGVLPTLTIDGGTSTVNFGANSSITNDQNRTTLMVQNSHTGTLNMDGNISSTAGDGIVFNNADGTYNFNGTTSLDGTDRGIYVINSSAGTFAFSEDTAIANTVDAAVELQMANADNLDFTYSGTIQNSTGMAIGVFGGPSTGQSVLFNSTAADAIQDSGEGIVIADTNADVNIQSDAELTGTSGVTVRNSTGTYTFADTDIAQGSPANPALWINGGTSTVNFGTDSSVTHDQLHDVVRVENVHTGTLNMDGAISATAGNGIVFDNADGTYNFNGTTNLNGTARGIDVANGSAGTFTFSEDTSIANTGNEAIRINTATADNLDFTYSGTIQNSTDRAISITGGPGSGQSVLFNSTATDAIQDSGTGILIAGTDADVNIQSDTELTGSSGLIIAGSDGTYTFADTDIDLSSGAIAPLLIDGGTSDVIFGANSSITNDMDRIALLVQGGHTGTLTMDGSISSTDGAGVQFNNADGTYNFNGTTTLDGTDRGIRVYNGSAGTFAFSEDTSIANTLNSAVQLDMASADNLDFTYSGTIQNSTGRAIDISGGPGTGQTVLFNSTAADAIQDSGEGIRIADTDADVNIQSDTELTGSNGVEITGSTGTYAFADTDINLSSGTDPSLWIDGGSSTVNFGGNSSITNNQNRSVVTVEKGHTGTLNMDGTISTTAGDGIVFDYADGTYHFNGTTNLNGTTRGIDVDNGSAGTFAFSENTSITNTTDEAIRMDLTNADNLDFTYSGTIQNSTGRAIDISGGPGTGQTVLFNSTAADAIQDSGEGIRIASTDADVNIQSDTELTGSNGVEITGSTGTYTFADTDINLGSGTSPSLLVNGGSGTINFGANSSITNNSNRRVVDIAGHTGTLNMDGTISSTAGDGIIFNNADGTYNFNGTTNLNGTSNGIQITNGSSGTFTFSADTSITNTTGGAAFEEANSTANVTYNGTITQNTAQNAVNITDKTGGSTTFNGQVTANTSSATAIYLEDNAGSTTNFNGGLDIDTTTGTGLYASNAGNVNITGAGNSVFTTDGTGIHIADTTVDMIFSDITVLENSSGGDAITLRSMGGDFEVTGTTSIGSNGTVGNGINISSGTTAQTGTITFGDVNLGAAGAGGTGRAISVDGSNQTIRFSNTSISGNWGAGADVRYRGIGSAGSLWFDELNNTGTTTGRGLTIQNAAGNVTVNSGTITGQGGNALDVENGTGAITIFADVTDLSGGGNVVSISGRSPTSQAINISGDVTGTGGGILVDNNTGGTVNFSGTVNMTGDRGLYVDTNSGTTINFTGPDTIFDTSFTSVSFLNNNDTTAVNFNAGNLDISSIIGNGISATGAGSISINGNNNSIVTHNDDAIVVDGIGFSLNNTWVTNLGAFYTIDTANSTLSGSGNIAPGFNSNDGGGNTGVIEFNGGLDLAP